jgi:GT2 family glycosyltransferase
MHEASPDSALILIPVHNRKKTTLAGLEILRCHGEMQRYRVVVIDDGSEDGTESAIRTYFPEVELLKGDGNLWWTGAIRLGMEYAEQNGGQSVFWLNDDCVPTQGSLAKMQEASVNHENAIIGAACYVAETGELKPTGALGRSRKAAPPGTLVPVDEMSGHCVYIPSTVIRSIGFPDTQKFPHYHGDSSYILQATQAGHHAYLLGDAQVTHPGVVKSQLMDFIGNKNESLASDLKIIFLNKKSLYFLPTQYHYNTLKYGEIWGRLLFISKLSWWLMQLPFLALTSVLKKNEH